MSHWYEVFDNEEVQWQARRQATHLTALAAGSVVATLVLAALALGHVLALPLAGVAVAVLWTGTVLWMARRQRALRRIVWCIKLSEDGAVGYDYTRSKHTLRWTGMARLELARRGLLLVGDDGATLEVPHLFPDFHFLSHRAVHYAERHDVPVYIDGQPWQMLDVYALFPFLADDAPEAPA